jgi:transcriptional regulator with XRE-family HTH domain
LHRIADARRRQGVSVRSAARRMGTSMDQVRRQEDPYADLTLSDLYRWQEALEVPVADLLVESDAPLSEPVLTRARLLRVMKTVRAIKESSTSTSIASRRCSSNSSSN